MGIAQHGERRRDGPDERVITPGARTGSPGRPARSALQHQVLTAAPSPQPFSGPATVDGTVPACRPPPRSSLRTTTAITERIGRFTTCIRSRLDRWVALPGPGDTGVRSENGMPNYCAGPSACRPATHSQLSSMVRSPPEATQRSTGPAVVPRLHQKPSVGPLRPSPTTVSRAAVPKL